MKKFLNSKILIIAFAIIAMLGGTFLFNVPNKVFASTTETAVESDGIVFTAKVVERTKETTESNESNNNNIFGAEVSGSLANGKAVSDNANSDYVNHYVANTAQSSNYETSYVQNIALNKHTMLKNDNSTTVQNAYISFGWNNIFNIVDDDNTKTYIYELIVGLTLTQTNGETVPLYTREVEERNGKKYYQQYFDLYYNETSAGDSLNGYEANQGTYTITFTYRTKSENIVSESKTVSYSFTLLRQEHYSSEFEVDEFEDSYKTYEYSTTGTNHSKLDDEDTYVYAPFIKNRNTYFQVFNTNENSDNSIYGLSTKTKFNTFFNYADRTQMPTITFNPDKFTVKVSRTYYTTTSGFSLGNGITNIENEKECGVDVDNTNKNKVTIKFIDLGVYTISYEYVFFGTVMNESNSQRMLICGEQLNVFGTKILYANNTISEAEMFADADNNAYVSQSITVENEETSQEINPYTYLTSDNLTSVNPVTKKSNISVVDNKEVYYSNMKVFTIPSTNQAPVWINSLGIVASSSRYYKWNGSSWDAAENYINGKKFSDSGIYLLAIDYTYADWTAVMNKNSTAYSYETQWFCFKVENKTPTLSVEANSIEVASSTKVNKEVSVAVSGAKGEFDSDVKLEIGQYAGELNGESQYSTIITKNGYAEINDISITKDGTYRVRLYYGATVGGVQSTFTERIFTIDTVAPVLRFNDGAESELTNFVTATSKSFDVKKDNSSNDVETFTYSYATFSKNEEISLNGDYMFNGYTLSGFTAEIDYSNEEIKVAGVYIFTATDEAGNKTQRIVILDNTAPTYTQNPPQESNNPLNVFTEKVTVNSGKYKAIDITNAAETINNLTPSGENNLSEYFNGTNYYVSVNTDETSIAGKEEGEEDSKPYNNTNFTKYTGSYGGTGFISEVELIEPEEDSTRYYTITVTDALGNSFSKDVEINMDYSKGYISSKNEIYFDNSNNNAPSTGLFRVRNNSITNLQEVSFEFKLGEEDYEVISLTYTYYPFSHDTTSNNYPFTQTPAIKDKDILSTSSNNPEHTNGNIIEEGKHLTTIINPTYSSTYGATVTAEGYYVISRLYKKDELKPENAKTYAFIVDRNHIKSDISYDENGNEKYTWGENIFFNFNNETEKGTLVKHYTSFISNISNNPENSELSSLLISTNKLPVYLNVPKFKYDRKVEDNSVITNPTQLNPLNVKCEIKLEYITEQNTTEYEYVTLFEVSNYEITYNDYSARDIYTMPSKFTPDITYCRAGEEATLNNKTLTFEQLRDFCLTFRTKAVYKIYISDSVELQSTKPDSTIPKANTLIFEFEIKHTAPTGYWNSNKSSYYSEYAILDTESNYADFVFSNYKDITKAEIDINNIKLFQIFNNQRTEITVSSEQLIIDNEDDFSTTYILRNLDATKEYIYELTIQYKGNESDYVVGENNYFKKTYYLIIDKTKPTYTMQNIIASDNYSNKNNYISYNEETGEYTVDENFFFIVDSNHVFTQCSDEFINAKYHNLPSELLTALKKTETNIEYYYRAYDKFKVGEANLSSMLPDNPDYENYNVQRDRPRFNRYSSAYKTIQYGSSLAELPKNRFYEIIEVDGANNYSSFTIYLSDTKTVSINYSANDLTNTVTKPTFYEFDGSYSYNYSDNLSTLILNSLAFTHQDENKNNTFLNDMFFSVEVVIGGETQLFNFTNADFNIIYNSNSTVDFTINKNLTIASINQFITEKLATEEIIINGTSIDIKVYSRYTSESQKDVINFNFRIQGTKKLELTYSQTENGNIEIIVPAQTESTYIVSFKIFEVINGVKQENSKYNFTNPYITAVGEANSEDISIVLDNENFNPQNVYVIEYVDNFGFEQVLIVNLKYENDIANERLQYNNEKSVMVNGIVNTCEQVKFTYQSYLYSITVTKNGEELTSYTSSKDAETGKVTLTFNPENNFTTKDEYSILVRPIVSEEASAINYSFVISTLMPNIQIKDFLDNILYDANSATTNLKTAQRIFLNWESNITDYNPTFTISTPNGSYAMESLVNGKSYFSELGSYTIIQTNDIGNERIIEFEVIEDSNTFYWVENVENKTTLTPSSERYLYNDNYITFFNTSLSYPNYSVIANIDKGLKAEFIETITQNSVSIKIFRIYGETTHVYEEFIAIATINRTESVLTNSAFKINGYSTSVNPYSSYGKDGKITLTWNAYHLISCNPVIGYVSFNNGEFKKIENFTTNEAGTTNSITLSVGGTYKFYFQDNSGNLHVFNNGTVNKTNYLTINLVNSVWLRIKSANETDFRDIINYEVFNSDVSVEIYGTEFIKNGTLEYSVLRNGKDYNSSQQGNVLTLKDYGFYAVTVKAIENLSGNENEIISTIYFTIIDNNETRSIFDYSTANNQGIYKVEKLVGDNYVNITNELLELYEVGSLNSLFISTFTIGVGKYNIYVEDNSNAELTSTKKFNFSVWINNEMPALIMSRNFGTSATSKVNIKINPALIYSQLGNCSIVISNYGTILINEESSSNVDSINLTSVGEYYVSIISSSGKVIFSNKITITEALNSVAIMVIVIIVIVAVIGVLVFLKLRNRLKVR